MRDFRHHPKHNSRNNHRQHRPAKAYVHPAPRRVIDEAEARFLAGTPIDPAPRIRLEEGSGELTMRAMDLICPIGMGQRGLIVAPPGSGKTTILKHLCQAVAKAHPDVKLYCLLVDERPEEVTDFRRSVAADVRWSSSDQSYDNHVKTADELIRQAIGEVADGKNVMILIDSLTRLARVHNAERRSSGRTISGGLDARALEIPRRIFGQARKIEHGGSLSILATILVQTGSRMDDVIFEEFKGTGNMEIVLSRDIAGRRIFPAIDIHKSATRKMENLMGVEELDQTTRIRRALAQLGAVEAASALLKQLEKYPSNKDLLAAVGAISVGE